MNGQFTICVEYADVACCCGIFRYWFTCIFTVTTSQLYGRVQWFADRFAVITLETKSVIHSRNVTKFTICTFVLDTIHSRCICNWRFTSFWCHHSVTIFSFHVHICWSIPFTIIGMNCIFRCIVQISWCFCCRNIYLRSIFTIFTSIFQC